MSFIPQSAWYEAADLQASDVVGVLCPLKEVDAAIGGCATASGVAPYWKNWEAFEHGNDRN